MIVTIRHALMLLIALCLCTTSALAECDPSVQDCGTEPPEILPTVGITPAGGTYTSDSPVTVPVTIQFYDSYGLNASSRQVQLWSGTSSAAVEGTWTLSTDTKRGTFRANVLLSTAGAHVLKAQITDRDGYIGRAEASFQFTLVPKAQPVISETSFHNGFRNTTVGALTLTYGAPVYTSLDQQRSAGLLYVSEHAKPSALVTIDAKPDPATSAQFSTMSLRIEDEVGNTVSREQFHKARGGDFQRMVAWWDMAGKPTGAYEYWAVVRAYRAANDYREKRTKLRILVVNDVDSRYGAGWSIAGIPRLHPSAKGVLLNEGTGVVRWFDKTATGGYVTPLGDFTSLVQDSTTKKWTRTFVGGASMKFSEAGFLESATDSVGRVTTYQWQSSASTQHPQVISRITDPVGKTTAFYYSATGYLKHIQTPGARSVYFDHASSNLTGLYGPTNMIVTYAGHLPSTYNTNLGGADSGVTRDVAYDAYNRVSSVTEPAITIVGGQTVRPRARTQSVPSRFALAATQGTSIDNAAPFVTPENATAIWIDPLDHETRIGYDRYGHAVSIDAAGRMTGFAYYDNGLLQRRTEGSQVIGYHWNDKGQPLTVTFNDVVVYEAVYNSTGQLTSETRGSRVDRYAYEARGRLQRAWYGKPEDATLTGTTYEYDDTYSQLIRITSPKGAKAEQSYDATWRNTEITQTIREDGQASQIKYVYDDLSRVSSTVNLAAGGDTTTFTYDAVDRVTRVTDPQGLSVTYTYAGPHLTRVTDRAGKNYDFEYNVLGWLLSERFPNNTRSVTYAYNADGMVASSTDRRGRVVTRTYDASHRLSDLTADDVTTTYRYPDLNTTVIWNPESAVTIKTGSNGIVESVASTLGGRLYAISYAHDPALAFEYKGLDLKVYSSDDTLLRSESIRHDSNYSPGLMGIQSTHTIRDISGKTTTVAADTVGLPKWIKLPNNVTEYRGYATDGRLQWQTYEPAAVNNRLGAGFAYDLQFRLTGRNSSAGDRTWSFGYDNLGQVNTYNAYRASTAADCTGSGCPVWVAVRQESYTYDAAGNRTDRGAVIEPSSNRYSKFNGVSLKYDEEGNIIRKVTTGVGSVDQTFTWDSLGRLTRVVTNGLTINYGYDGLGRRVRRSTPTQTQYYLYDGDDLLEEIDAAGNPIRTYTYWPGVDQPHSVRVRSGGTSDMYYYALEQPGHVIGVLDRNGAVAGSYRYTPWGEVETSPELNSEVANQPLRYMARELDSITGLYYVRNRWYDVSLARFVSEDPIGLAGGMNTYTYAANDPVNQRDPSGLAPELTDDVNPICYMYPWKRVCRAHRDENQAIGLDPFVVTAKMRPGRYRGPGLAPPPPYNPNGSYDGSGPNGGGDIERGIREEAGKPLPVLPCTAETCPDPYYERVQRRKAQCLQRAQQTDSRFGSHIREWGWEGVGAGIGWLVSNLTPPGRVARWVSTIGGAMLAGSAEVEVERTMDQCKYAYAAGW